MVQKVIVKVKLEESVKTAQEERVIAILKHLTENNTYRQDYG